MIVWSCVEDIYTQPLELWSSEMIIMQSTKNTNINPLNPVKQSLNATNSPLGHIPLPLKVVGMQGIKQST